MQAACTATADTVCLACTTCGAGQFQTAACGPLADAQCSPCSSCTAGQFQTAACGPAADTQCASCASCTAEQYMQGACTSTADTVCTPCSSLDARCLECTDANTCTECADAYTPSGSSCIGMSSRASLIVFACCPSLFSALPKFLRLSGLARFNHALREWAFYSASREAHA